MGAEAALTENELTAADPATGHPLMAFAPRLALWVAIVALDVVADPDPALVLLLIALAGVVTIVTDSRFAWERGLEARSIPSREAWVPLAMLGLMLQLDLVQSGSIGDVLGDKGPVILFIMGFALVSEGLRRSGFIHFLAYRLTDRGGSNTTRLTLYLFLLSSLLTYFTSNDIVVLTMTPIVMSVAYQARIRNAKLLLLSQFIAANTVSMGILIGSPTNLILGQAMDIRFVEYLFLMLAPATVALMVTFVFVTWVNGFVEKRGRSENRVLRWLVGTWTHEDRYSPPRFSEYRTFTGEMRTWVGVFALAVLLLTVGTATNTGLLLAAIAIAGLGLYTLRRSARNRDEPTGRLFMVRSLRVLPFGIVFFGLTYFVLADAMADTRFVQEDVDEFVTDHASSHTPVPSWGAMLTSGGLVNTMNDLPASALTGTVLERVEFDTPFDRALVVQGTAAGLNIATYVTPVGALAGIIWFDILRKEKQSQRLSAAKSGRAAFDVVTPSRRDLVVYGSVMFLATTAVLGATNFGFVALADALLGPPSGGSEFGTASSHMFWMVVCLALVVAVVVAFRRVLSSAGVALSHLGDVLVVLTQVRLWASRHKLLAAACIAGLLFTASGVLLYWAETFHAREYGRSALFEDPGEFMTWLTVFVSSGFENSRFPRSTLGHILSAALALGALTALLAFVRISTSPTDLGLRRKLARGEIPSERLVVVNCAVDNLALVQTLIKESGRFVTIASRDPLLETRFGLRKNDRVDVIPYEGGTAELVGSLRLHEAHELVLLSRSVTDDFENLALLAALDAQMVTPPATVLQVHERELSLLLDRRVSSELRSAVVRTPFDLVVSAFLVADAAGLPAELQGLYREPLVGRTAEPDVDPHIRLRGVGHPLTVGVDSSRAGAGPRSVVHVVGAGCFAQTCALDLVTLGVPDVRLVVAADEPLLPGVTGTAGLTVVSCDNERDAADLLSPSASPDDAAILLLEGAGEVGLDSERLLERLSIARLHHGDSRKPVPFLLVGCRGADRAWRIGNFVVDKAVDTTWVESSYFSVFSAVYFDVLLADEELANWLPVRQLAVAHRVASQLCHFEVAPVGSLRSAAEGSVRIAIEHDDDRRPLVAVDVKMVPDEQLAPVDLLVGISYR
ncbi:MAG TPA: anion permease [Acidimicrobiales bacterium]|nr:anion permease [Acidimicrobiales bacterium]